MLNIKKVFNYFKSTFDLRESRNNWWRFANPFDNHKDLSMAVNFEYLYVKDFRTGYKEKIINFVAEYENIHQKEAYYLLNSFSETNFSIDSLKKINYNKNKVLNLPTGYKSLYTNTLLAKRAQNYLIDRGFDIDFLAGEGFGYMNEGPYIGCIFIPFIAKGKLVYYIFRNFIEGPIRYMNPPESEIGIGKSEVFFNEDALQIYDEVYLLEGWSDAATMGKNSIASLGWSLSSTQISKILKSNIKTLTIIPDRGYTSAAKKLAFNFIEHKKIKVPDFDSLPEYINDKKIKDVNDIGKDAIIQLIKKTNYLTTEDIINEAFI